MNLILLGLSIMIVSTGCSSDAEKQAAEKLYLAISFNNIQACEEALRDGNIDLEKLPKKELTELGAYDRRALALAIDHSVDHRIIQMLIDHGADVNSTMKGSKSYLTQAVLNGDYELCKMLLDAGADAEQKQD